MQNDSLDQMLKNIPFFLFLPEAAEAPEGAFDERFLLSPQQLPGGSAEGGGDREGVRGQSPGRIQSPGEFWLTVNKQLKMTLKHIV